MKLELFKMSNSTCKSQFISFSVYGRYVLIMGIFMLHLKWNIGSSEISLAGSVNRPWLSSGGKTKGNTSSSIVPFIGRLSSGSNNYSWPPGGSASNPLKSASSYLSLLSTLRGLTIENLRLNSSSYCLVNDFWQSGQWSFCLAHCLIQSVWK